MTAPVQRTSATIAAVLQSDPVTRPAALALIALVTTVAPLRRAAGDPAVPPSPAAGATAARPPARHLVAVLPFTVSDGSLSLYSRAAATALARALGGAPGIRARALSLDDPVPVDVALVVDGRLVGGSRGAVAVHLSVRDPETGATVATVATATAPRDELDALVDRAAARLRRPLRAALAARERRRAARRQPIRLPPTVVRLRGAGPPVAAAPPLVVWPAAGAAVGGAVDIAPLATDAAAEIAARLGFRPVAAGRPVPEPGAPPSPAEVAARVAAVGARGALWLRVQDVTFGWAGVLIARGRVRVVAYGPDGRVRFDRVARTDTIVGSRGDRHAAVARMVLAQVADIAVAALDDVMAP